MKIRHETKEFVDELSDGRKSVGSPAETVHLENRLLAVQGKDGISVVPPAPPEYAPAKSVIFMLIGWSYQGESA